MTQSNQRNVTIAITALILLVFWDNPLLWPLKILVVLFHELSHAAAALLTGGEVLSIGLEPNQGGVTHTRGGFRFLVLNAGYLGSLGFGIALLAAARTPRAARVGVAILALVLLGSTLFWVRPLASFGFAFALLATGGIAWLARSGSPGFVQGTLRTLGVFSALYALWDIRSDVFGGSAGLSDASMLAELTYIPAVVWGALWLAAGIGALWATRRWW